MKTELIEANGTEHLIKIHYENSLNLYWSKVKSTKKIALMILGI